MAFLCDSATLRLCDSVSVLTLPHAAAERTLIDVKALLCALALAVATVLTGCASSKPVPLSVRVTSVPADADVQLHCPQVEVQQGVTPAKFRIPPYATPCALTVSKSGYRDRRLDVTLDMLQPRGGLPPAPPPERIHFTEDATPFSLLGALIVRSLDNLGESVAQRVASAAIPDARIEVVLEPTLP